MTFAEIKGAIKDLCNLTSTDADTRVGKSVNRHYKRVTSSLGMDATRFVTRSQSTTNGVRTVTFTSIEHIDRVIDATDSNAIRPLVETSVDTLRNEQPGTGQPTRYAIQSITSTSVTILIDTLPQVTYSLQADGTAALSDLTGSDVPAIPESYHDILTFSVIAEELLKKEKVALAHEYASGDENRPGRAEKLLAALRFQLADSHSYAMRQGDRTSTVGSGSGSGGSGSVGGTAYTQTALLTFDRGAGIVPFAVARTDAPYVVNLGAEFLGNITTDRLIGRDTAGTGETEQLTASGGIEFTGAGGIQTSAFTGDVTKSAGGTATAIANDAVTYAKMQNVSAASRLVGRGSAGGSGDPEEISLGSGLSLSGTTLSATMQLLYANSGTNTSAVAANVDTVAISGLTAKDRIIVEYNFRSITQATSAPKLHNSTDSVDLANLVATATAGTDYMGQANISQMQSAATRVGIVVMGAAANPDANNNVATFTQNYTGSWTLAFRHAGVTAGGTFQWSWAIHIKRGQ
jgi:hypothetical protein